MTTKAHKLLTGTDLHENKGAASASDNTVATVTGGATVWKKLTKDNLTGTANPFGGQLFHVRDVKATSVAGGTATQGSWLRRDLNTSVTNEISSASLSSNQISLPAGTYYVEAASIFFGTVAAQTRFQNVTDSTTLVLGMTGYASNSMNAILRGRFTLADTKTIELQYQVANTHVTDGLGVAGTWGDNIYSEVQIWKVT